jgi:uncharacterized protein YjiS (DUF1127 family)
MPPLARPFAAFSDLMTGGVEARMTMALWHANQRDAARSPTAARDSPRRLRWFLLLQERIAVWRRRARERKRLAEMSDYALKDIGLSRADAWQEYSKPFWRP